MFDFTQDAHVDLRDFVRLHSEALQNAAALLGSHLWLKRMKTFINDVLEANTVTRRIRAELKAMVTLLSLQHIGDPETIEAMCFSDLDPASPIVEEICLLTDAMTDLHCRLGADCVPNEFDQRLA